MSEHRLSRRGFLAGAAAGAGALLAAGCDGAGNVGLPFDADTPPVRPPEGEGRVRAPGGEIWYRVAGTGPGTPLVVIHGGPGLSHDYLLPLAELGRDRPVVFYDQLDCGKSDHPGDPGNWRVGRFLSEIDALRQGLGLNRFHLLGHAWGGLLAAEYAAGNQRWISGCVLASPLLSAEVWAADTRRWRRLLPDDVQAVLDANEAAGTVQSDAYQQALNVFYRRHLCRMDPWPAPLLASLEVGNSSLYVAMWGETEFHATGVLRGYDASASVTRLAQPTLFTCGEFDEAAPVSMYRYSALVADAEVRVIANASHTPHLEQTAAYNQAVGVFLNGIG
jgi:proline iminopeptidase